jgi:hypothetical protein
MDTGGSFPGHLHLVSRSKNDGAIPPLPQHVFMAWCLVKHRDEDDDNDNNNNNNNNNNNSHDSRFIYEPKENRVFRPSRGYVTSAWSQLRNEELNNMNTSENKRQ